MFDTSIRKTDNGCGAIQRLAAATQVDRYARCEDFRGVFLENLNLLYQLALLLMVDPKAAEQCLMDAFDECVRSQQVFKEWALTWAKRTVIQRAVRELRPRGDRGDLRRRISNLTSEKPKGYKQPCFKAAAILSLQHFERFAFVLTVLDEYPDRDCALLLDCLVQDIRDARDLALNQLAASIPKTFEHRRNHKSIAELIA